MEITRIKMYKGTEGTSIAKATVTLDNELAIQNIKLVEANSNIYMNMPSRKVDKKMKDWVHPVNAAFRDKLQTKLIEAYNKMIEDNLVVIELKY